MIAGPDALTTHVTCLGCGCACDDIIVHVREGRIIEAEHACPRGIQWFGDGSVPSSCVSGACVVSLDVALDDAARVLAAAEQVLVYLAADLSCEAQREGVAIADLLGAQLTCLSACATLPAVLAAQRRGRAGATLGEIRNRADLVVFWGVDPSVRYPRFLSRFASETRGTRLPDRRQVIAVDVGDARGPDGAGDRVRLPAEHETSALAAMRAAVLGRPVDRRLAGESPVSEWASQMTALATTLSQARYAALVYDAERADASGANTEALLTLAQTLNGPTRCAAVGLRDGGNRAGAEAVMTSQTGFPMSVDFARGAPRYRPELDVAERFADREIEAVLVLGAPASVPARIAEYFRDLPSVAIGPRATESGGAVVAIDTGVAGIHEGGIALRMDDVPLPLRPALTAPVSAVAALRALRERVERRGGAVGAHVQ
jgi:formylmethanofuran dehydrogenase subunit B